ncbi:putative transposase [Wolbachia endosymbiont of Trichogramma pretiosum]|nr:putative transposase [Wolbachia endosymbiont of Trichogramma pretiosum]
MPTKMKISNCHGYNRFLQERENIFHFINEAILRSMIAELIKTIWKILKLL